MAYTIHIHRKATRWDAPGEGDITLNEVRALVARYPHIEFVEQRERVGLGLCCGGETRWVEENILMGFQYANGALTADYVDDETIYRGLYLAGLLGAKVQGDEGEFYRATLDGIAYFKD